jgi:hypothetical protein
MRGLGTSSTSSSDTAHRHRTKCTTACPLSEPVAVNRRSIAITVDWEENSRTIASSCLQTPHTGTGTSAHTDTHRHRHGHKRKHRHGHTGTHAPTLVSHSVMARAWWVGAYWRACGSCALAAESTSNDCCDMPGCGLAPRPTPSGQYRKAQRAHDHTCDGTCA